MISRGIEARLRRLEELPRPGPKLASARFSLFGPPADLIGARRLRGLRFRGPAKFSLYSGQTIQGDHRK